MRGSRRRQPDSPDGGFALLVVLGGMLALTMVLISTVSYVAASAPVARRGQDSAAALQAAQAGIDDYLARLVTCNLYWRAEATCRTGSTNAALTLGTPGAATAPGSTGWADVPGTPASAPAQYHVDELSTPPQGQHIVLRSTGRVLLKGRAVKRSIEATITKPSLLQYIYYTDKEAFDPSYLMKRFPPRREKRSLTASNSSPSNSDNNHYEYTGISSAEASKCDRYWYATPTTPVRNQFPTETRQEYASNGQPVGSPTSWPKGCDISFGPSDVIDGKLHTNDAMLLNGPLFRGVPTTSWASGATPAPSTTAWYRLTPTGVGPQAAGHQPRYGQEIRLPDSNSALKDMTDPARGGAGGCPYAGNTRIVLKDNGTMDVTSPLTTSTNPACTTGSATSPGLSTTQNVPLPKNGVIYVDASTASCPRVTAFPLDARDVTRYRCEDGNVFVQGTLKGQLTIASRSDIIVTGNVSYLNGTSGSDVLGLIGEGDVTVYHPVLGPTACSTSGCTYDNIDVGLNEVTIHAAVLSVQHSFTVQNYDRGAKLGKITLVGGIYQKYRGPVGTSGEAGTGYTKDYRYDSRLATLTPPYFLDPVTAEWRPLSYAEVKVPAGLPA